MIGFKTIFHTACILKSPPEGEGFPFNPEWVNKQLNGLSERTKSAMVFLCRTLNQE
jgi:hypothetical protein